MGDSTPAPPWRSSVLRQAPRRREGIARTRLDGFHELSGLERLDARVVAAGVAIVLAAIFVPLALLGLVDPDEGMYPLNARLVLEGKVPYRDFHYPQMPLLPYLYGAWMRLTGVS